MKTKEYEFNLAEAIDIGWAITYTKNSGGEHAQAHASIATPVEHPYHYATALLATHLPLFLSFIDHM